LREFQRSSHCDSGGCVEVSFFKSSYSSTNGSCVEVGFQKSSRSSTNASCVEAKICTCDEILVRDSKDREGPVLTFTRAEWSAFLAGVKDEEFELPPVA
jgi:hypothetical protein